MIRKYAVFNRKISLTFLMFIVFLIRCAYSQAADNTGYEDILDNFGKDTENQKLIVPGHRVGSLLVGKPIPRSFIEFYGAPDSYAKPSKTIDSGSVYWKYKLLVKLNDRQDRKNIYSIWIEDPIFTTATGIGIGSTFKNLKLQYPKGKENLDQAFGESQTAWELEGIIFYIDNGKISKIFVSKHLHYSLPPK